MKCNLSLTMLASLQFVSLGFAQLDAQYQTASQFSSGSCASPPAHSALCSAYFSPGKRSPQTARDMSGRSAATGTWTLDEDDGLSLSGKKHFRHYALSWQLFIEEEVAERLCARSKPKPTTSTLLLYQLTKICRSLQEQEVSPRCIVRPDSAKDVSLAVAILTVGETFIPGKCQFAVRGGGHTPFAGSANNPGGITIDLALLNQVTIKKDRSTVTIGPGNSWGDVYSQITPQNLAIGGGRVAIVGVGGLVLGGGISFFSPRIGFVCDTVKRFETVLASGKIVDATSTNNKDLWLALKGGSNNFGIVTAFEMEAFEQGDFWGGSVVYEESTFDAQFEAFEQLNAGDYDEYAALINSYAWIPETQSWICSNSLEYTKPQEYPPAFENFTSLPSIASTMRISDLTDFTVEVASSNPGGRRQLFSTATFRNSAEMMKKVYEIANETVREMGSVSGLSYSLSFQPIPVVLLEKAQQQGGNSLGIDPSNGPLTNFLLTVSWDDAQYDALVNQKAQELYERSEAAAAEMGVQEKYLYLNYAAQWQDPITGYGADVNARFQAVSKKYDPQGVFQKQVPGGFKL